MSGTTRKLIDPLEAGGAGDAGTPAPSSYEAHYGLVEPPFSLTPGLRFAYNSRSHATALSQVRQALQRREGLIVVTGEVGTGKTMLCRALTQDSSAGMFVSLVLDPCLTADEILEHVLTDFGVMNEEVGSFGRLAPQVPRHQMLILLQRFLVSLIPLGGRAVVVIDEAQHLRPEVLEQIRLWSNFETSDMKLLQIVLAGQSELDEILRRPEMRQIQQRISRRCELTPLSRDEVAEYIEHRLWVARGFIIDEPPDTTHRETAAQSMSGPAFPGAPAPRRAGVRFTPAASQAVASISGGIPRLVNLLCDRSLEVGCEQQAENIDKQIVEVAARRLNLAAPPGAPEQRTGLLERMPRITPRVGLAAAAVVLMTAAPFVWRELPLSASASPPETAADVTPPPPPAMETLQTQAVLNVTIATFSSEQRAKAVAADLAADGYPAFTRREPGGAAYHLIVGPYVSSEAAEAARRALAAHGVDGTEVQIDNAAAGFSADVRYQKETPRPEPAPARPQPRTNVAPTRHGPGSSPAADKASATAAAYVEAVNPAVEHFERLAPFLVSAAASPSAPVLKALEDTLTTLGQSIAGVDVPTESRDAHQRLTTAISKATTAVTPGFKGDRTAQTREALTLLEQIRTAGPRAAAF